MVKILVVDDSKDIRKVVATTLQEAGYEVIEAENGKAAIDALVTQAVGLVITDLNMPEMDGLQLVAALRGNPVYKNTPILLHTSESAPEQKERGRAAGATGWVVKPCRPKKLLQVINTLCL